MYSFGCSSEIGGFDEDQQLSGDELGPGSMSTGPGLDPFFNIEQPGDGEYYGHFGPAAVIAGEGDDDLSGEIYSGANPALVIGAEGMRQRGRRPTHHHAAGHHSGGLHLGLGSGSKLRSIRG